jgi:hypothetical protein
MLIFAGVGAGVGWQYLRDRVSGRDVLGARGRPVQLVALLAMGGVMGSGLFAAESASVAAMLFWMCLLTGAQAAGFVAIVGAAYVRTWLR